MMKCLEKTSGIPFKILGRPNFHNRTPMVQKRIPGIKRWDLWEKKKVLHSKGNDPQKK